MPTLVVCKDVHVGGEDRAGHESSPSRREIDPRFWRHVCERTPVAASLEELHRTSIICNHDPEFTICVPIDAGARASSDVISGALVLWEGEELDVLPPRVVEVDQLV